MLIKTGFNIALALAVCGWVVILLGAVFSVMAFDAPGSQGRWQAWAFVGGMIALALLCLAAIIGAKMLFQEERIALAFALLFVPAAVGAAFLVKRFVS